MTSDHDDRNRPFDESTGVGSQSEGGHDPRLPSRRQFIGKAARSAKHAYIVPVVLSLTASHAAAASAGESCGSIGDFCITNDDCCGALFCSFSFMCTDV